MERVQIQLMRLMFFPGPGQAENDLNKRDYASESAFDSELGCGPARARRPATASSKRVPKH